MQSYSKRHFLSFTLGYFAQKSFFLHLFKLLILLATLSLTQCSSLSEDLNGEWGKFYEDDETVAEKYSFFDEIGRGEHSKYYEDGGIECRFKYDYKAIETDVDQDQVELKMDDDNYCIDNFSKDVRPEPKGETIKISVEFDGSTLKINGESYEQLN